MIGHIYWFAYVEPKWISGMEPTGYDVFDFLFVCFYLKTKSFIVYKLFACMCVYASCVSGTSGGQNWASDPLELELETVASCHVCAGKQISVLCRKMLLMTGPFLQPMLVCFWILLKVLASLFIREVGL